MQDRDFLLIRMHPPPKAPPTYISPAMVHQKNYIFWNSNCLFCQIIHKKFRQIFMDFSQYSKASLPAILQTTSAYLRSFSLSGPSLSAPAISNSSYSDFHSFDRTKPMHKTIPFHSILQRSEGSDCIRILIWFTSYVPGHNSRDTTDSLWSLCGKETPWRKRQETK